MKDKECLCTEKDEIQKLSERNKFLEDERKRDIQKKINELETAK